MSKSRVETFGETLRKMREGNKMPLRKLAALLDLDQSTLSKIERNERKANSIIITKLSNIFKVERNTLQISFISDKVAYELLEVENPKVILKAAEQKIMYLKQNKKSANV